MEMYKTAFQILTGDITSINADAIVNPTDSACSGSGGIDFAIHKAAGRELKEALGANRRLETGKAIITPAFQIKSAKWIIHTAAPKWKRGFDQEEYRLAECYRNSLQLAIHHSCQSIAFPFISSGANGFPIHRAAEIAVRAVVNALKTVPDGSCSMQILFVCAEKYREVYQKHLKKAIIEAFLYDYSPESVPCHRSDKYYAYMQKLAILEWGDIKCHHKYHGNFAGSGHTTLHHGHSEYDAYAQNLDSWDYNTCLAYIIAIFRPPYTYDGTGLVLPHYEQCMNGTVRRVLLRMRTLLG